jgi:hypothetical protein
VKSHGEIDERSLALARVIAGRIDSDPEHRAIERARALCARWSETAPCGDVKVWTEVLRRSWPEIRAVLLEPSERGARLRQSNPFCGVISPRERWRLYRSFRHDPRTA